MIGNKKIFLMQKFLAYIQWSYFIHKIKGVSKIIAIVNQKGGVGKTTTSINLSTAFAAVGKITLLVDLDPQGNASTGLGVSYRSREEKIYTKYC